MSVVVGISGKKGSGKDTCANYLLGMVLQATGVVDGTFALDEKGHLHVSDLFGNRNYEGRFEFHRRDKEFLKFRQEHVEPNVYLYRYADFIKNEICQDIFGMTQEQVDNKDSVVEHMRWENMPGVVTQKQLNSIKEISITIDGIVKELGLIVHEPGPMTSREIQQFVGTYVFRKMYSDIWVKALQRRIAKDKPKLAIVTDIRFPNEVEGVYEIDGSVVRLLRKVYDDTHISETALDDYDGFSLVLGSQEQDREETLKHIHTYVSSLGVKLPFIIK